MVKFLDGLTRQHLIYLSHSVGCGSLAACLTGFAWPGLMFLSAFGLCSLVLVYLPMVVALHKIK